MHVIVAGGGMAGLSTALVLARRGRAVTLVERDAVEAGDDWRTAMDWPRGGIPHFHQPHAFLPRGRGLLRALLPDVYDELLAAGASEVAVGAKAPGGARAEDADLVYLAVRRQVIEWALRRAVHRTPGLAVRDGHAVTGLVADRHGGDCRIRGVRLGVDALVGDVVIDALGRRSPMPGWLARIGAAEPRIESSETELLYYSRYFALRPGACFPDGPWLLGPRGDLGYLAFTTFLGDNHTFALVLGVPTWDRELRALRHAEAFMAACGAIAPLAPLVDAALAEPITGVLPMGSLQNTLRTYPSRKDDGTGDGTADAGGAPPALGLFAVGDAYCHTNPMFALGLSLGLVHADAVAQVLAAHDDPRERLGAYLAATLPETAERFRLSRDIDEARSRLWRGEPLDLAHRAGSYPLFALLAGGAVAGRDPDVFRRVTRRAAFLDRTAALDDDVALQERIEVQFAQMTASGPSPRPGPSREALLRLVGRAGAPV